ncbi:MAG: molybdopterin-synthase adenylyltransferase MoeB [Candidatus Limnocylindrales bacterium]
MPATPTDPQDAPPTREVTTAEADALRRNVAALLLDVREPSEREVVHIPGSLHVPLGQLHQLAGLFLPDPARPIVAYCAVGVRSLRAASTLTALGYADVASMAGGIEAWQREGRDASGPDGLTPVQRQRYSRHLLIPEVGPVGQARLLASRVLLVGAGGLGSPAALYLAAAGVGTLGIVDFDVVDLSNLQRQVLHTTDRVGQPKVASAARTIGALNPDVRVVAHELLLGPDNVAEVIAGYDVVIDGTDSFETRYTLNDAAVAAGIPVVHASVYRFEGQLTVFVPGVGPCYRCLYPSAPPPELAPNCSAVGVLGVVPGIMGLLQANEALKLLLGVGAPLVGRLLLFDALDGEFRELEIRRDPACPACAGVPGTPPARASTAAVPLPVSARAPGA